MEIGEVASKQIALNFSEIKEELHPNGNVTLTLKSNVGVYILTFKDPAELSRFGAIVSAKAHNVKAQYKQKIDNAPVIDVDNE